MQGVRNWGSSWGRNAGLSPFLPKPEAWAKVDTEGRPRGPAWQGDGGELCFGLSKSRVEQPNLSLHGQIQGCRASQPWSRDDAPGLTTLAELGVRGARPPPLDAPVYFYSYLRALFPVADPPLILLPDRRKGTKLLK